MVDDRVAVTQPPPPPQAQRAAPALVAPAGAAARFQGPRDPDAAAALASPGGVACMPAGCKLPMLLR